MKRPTTAAVFDFGAEGARPFRFDWRRSRSAGRFERIRRAGVAGTMPDHRAAAIVGLPALMVGAFRAARQIPAFRREARIDAITSKLGVVSDVALAREAGVRIATIQKTRVARGIPAAPNPGRPKGPRRANGPLDTLLRAGERGPVTYALALDLLGPRGPRDLVAAAANGHFVRVSRGVYRLADPA